VPWQRPGTLKVVESNDPMRFRFSMAANGVCWDSGKDEGKIGLVGVLKRHCKKCAIELNFQGF
jgi:hypothetical protein